MPKPCNLLKCLVALLGNSQVALDVQLVLTEHIHQMVLLASHVELTGTAHQGLKENGLGNGNTQI